VLVCIFAHYNAKWLTSRLLDSDVVDKLRWRKFCMNGIAMKPTTRLLILPAFELSTLQANRRRHIPCYDNTGI